MKKIRFANIFLFFVLQGWLWLTSCFSEPPTFLDEESSHLTPILRRDTKIPVGVHDNTLHHITLPTGTSLHEIPSKISQKRTEVGLSPNIPFDQQNEFFQNLKWQTTQDILIKSPMPAKVVQVLVYSGQRVNQGDPLFTLECMKMQMCIRAPSPGETTHVFLEEGQLVDQDSALLALLPSFPYWEEVNQAQILDNKDLLMALFPWAAITPPFTNNAPSPHNGEKNKVSTVVSENESNLPLETSQLASAPSLTFALPSVPQPLSMVPEVIPDHQSNAQPPESLLETVILSSKKTEEILMPVSQNPVLAEQNPASLPIPQVIDDNEDKLQNENVIIASPLIKGNDVYGSLVEDKNTQVTETPQQTPSSSLPSEVNLFPNEQRHSHPLQEKIRSVLEPSIPPLPNTEKILVPPSQNTVLTEQTSASLPVLQAADNNKVKLQNENIIITSPLIEGNDVYSSLVEDKNTQVTETPQQAPPPVEARDDNLEAERDSKTLSKIKNAVIAKPQRERSNPCFRQPSIDSYFMEMVLRTSLPAPQVSYTPQNWKRLSLSPLNQSNMRILKILLNFPASLSKFIIPNDHIEIELEDTWAMFPCTGAKWLYGLIGGVSLLLFTRKNKLRSSAFGYFHSVDCNKYLLLTHYLADNLNFGGSPKGNTLRVPHLTNSNTIKWKKYRT